MTGRRHYLREVILAAPKAAAAADKARRRLAGQVNEERHPRTNATVDQLLDRHLQTLDVGRTTHRMYTRYLEKHVRPFIGRLKASGVNGEAGQVPPGLPSVPHSGLHTVPLGSLL